MVVQEACHVLEKYGCPVKEKLKSELCVHSTLHEAVSGQVISKRYLTLQH